MFPLSRTSTDCKCSGAFALYHHITRVLQRHAVSWAVWCLCRSQWREVAQELEGVVRIGAVNCGDDRMLCRNEGITGYPSLKVYPRVTKRTLTAFASCLSFLDCFFAVETGLLLSRLCVSFASRAGSEVRRWSYDAWDLEVCSKIRQHQRDSSVVPELWWRHEESAAPVEAVAGVVLRRRRRWGPPCTSMFALYMKVIFMTQSLGDSAVSLPVQDVLNQFKIF